MMSKTEWQTYWAEVEVISEQSEEVDDETLYCDHCGAVIANPEIFTLPYCNQECSENALAREKANR